MRHAHDSSLHGVGLYGSDPGDDGQEYSADFKHKMAVRMFWKYVDRGMSVEEAARISGISVREAKDRGRR